MEALRQPENRIKGFLRAPGGASRAKSRANPHRIKARRPRHTNRTTGYSVYAAANPSKYTDPEGRCPNCVTAGIGAVVGGLAGLAVEGYRQYQEGDLDWSSLGVEAGKGALVGALTGFTGGAIAATALSVPAKVALTGASSFAIGAAGDAGGKIAEGVAPSLNDAIVAGAANTVGVGMGAVVKPAATAITTTTKAAVKAYPVTSLTGRVFYTVNSPASTVTDRLTAEVIQNTAGESASATTDVLLERRSDREQ